jgi:hypothetical protein
VLNLTGGTYMKLVQQSSPSAVVYRPGRGRRRGRRRWEEAREEELGGGEGAGDGRGRDGRRWDRAPPVHLEQYDRDQVPVAPMSFQQLPFGSPQLDPSNWPEA